MGMAQSRAAEFVHRSAEVIIYTTLVRAFFVIIYLNSIEMRGIAQTMPVDQTSLVRSVMDLSADPCVDINQYACGNFSRLYPIPSDKSSYSLDDAVNSHIPHLITMRTIEEQAEAGGDRRPADVRQIGDFYASCMDTKTIKSRSGTALDPVFRDISSMSDRKTLPVLLAKLQLLRVSSFFSVKTTQDLTTGKLVIPKIDEAKLGLQSRQAYVADDNGQLSLRSRYLAHITKMLELSGESNQAASSDAQNIFTLESALARASLSAENLRDPRESNHELSVQQLSTLTPISIGCHISMPSTCRIANL